MGNSLGLMVHLINLFLQIVAVILAVRLIRLSGRTRAWVVLSCAFVLTAVHRFLDVLSHMQSGGHELEWNDVVVTFSALLLVTGVYLIREIFEEREQARQTLQKQLDELQRFQRLAVGRELRMKELVEENTALRSQLATAKPDSGPS